MCALCLFHQFDSLYISVTLAWLCTPPPPFLRMCGPCFNCHDWGWYGKTSRDAMIFTKKAKLKIHKTSNFSGDCIVLGCQLWRLDSQQKPGDAESFAYPWDHLQVSPSPTKPTLAARRPQNQIEIPQNQIKPASYKFHPPQFPPVKPDFLFYSTSASVLGIRIEILKTGFLCMHSMFSACFLSCITYFSWSQHIYLCFSTSNCVVCSFSKGPTDKFIADLIHSTSN